MSILNMNWWVVLSNDISKKARAAVKYAEHLGVHDITQTLAQGFWQRLREHVCQGSSFAAAFALFYLC